MKDEFCAFNLTTFDEDQNFIFSGILTKNDLIAPFFDVERFIET